MSLNRGAKRRLRAAPVGTVTPRLTTVAVASWRAAHWACDPEVSGSIPTLQLKRFVEGGGGASISKPADPHDLCPHSGADGRTAVYDQQVTARGGDKKRGHARTFPRVRSTWRSPPNTLSNWREPGSRSLGRVKGSSRG